MTGKQVVIDMSESVKNASGRDMEQLILRIIIIWLISGGDISQVQAFL